MSNASKRTTRADLIARLQKRTGLTLSDARHCFEAVVDSIAESLCSGKDIELRGFGIFSVRLRKGGAGRNIRTGEQVVIPARKVVKFRAGKELSKAVRGQ